MSNYPRLTSGFPTKFVRIIIPTRTTYLVHLHLHLYTLKILDEDNIITKFYW